MCHSPWHSPIAEDLEAVSLLLFIIPPTPAAILAAAALGDLLDQVDPHPRDRQALDQQITLLATQAPRLEVAVDLLEEELVTLEAAPLDHPLADLQAQIMEAAAAAESL